MIKLTPGLLSRFKEYEQSHQTAGNKWTHAFGIPFVLVSSVGLLARVHFEVFDFRLNLAIFVLVAVWIWGMRQDLRLGIFFGGALVLSFIAGAAMSVETCWVVFSVGWFLQFLGHAVFEKKAPALFKNLEFTLVALLWMLARAIGAHK